MTDVYDHKAKSYFVDGVRYYTDPNQPGPWRCRTYDDGESFQRYTIESDGTDTAVVTFDTLEYDENDKKTCDKSTICFTKGQLFHFISMLLKQYGGMKE